MSTILCPPTGVDTPLSFVTQGKVKYYTSGACGMLAVALHERFGLALVIIRGPKGNIFQDYVHVAALLASGQPIDIHGVWQSPEALLAYWCDIESRADLRLHIMAHSQEIKMFAIEHELRSAEAEVLSDAKRYVGEFVGSLSEVLARYGTS